MKKVNGKVIVAGPASVGKTCLVERFVSNSYTDGQQSTLGVDNQKASINVDGDTQVDLFIYDTAGQERFAPMSAAYYRIGQVCLLCFDMADISTFDKTTWWKQKVEENNPHAIFILVGTKEDLLSEEESNSEGMCGIRRWASESGIPFFPTSAKKGGDRITFLFHTVAEKCIRANQKQEEAKHNKVKLESSIKAAQVSDCKC